MTTYPGPAPEAAPPSAFLGQLSVLAAENDGGRAAHGIRARILDASVWPHIRLVTDAVVLLLALATVLIATPDLGGTTERLVLAVFPLVTLTVLCRKRRAPDELLTGSAIDTTVHVCAAVSLSALLTIATGSLVNAVHPVGLVLPLWLCSLGYLTVARLALLTFRHRCKRDPALATPTLIVGAGVIGARVTARLLDEPGYGLRPIGLLDADPIPGIQRPGMTEVPVLGSAQDLVEIVRRTGARQLILGFPSDPDYTLVEQVRECQRLGVAVSVVPRMYEAVNERATLDHVGGLPLLALRTTNPRSWQFAVKHGLDRSIALLGLVALAPLMLALAVAVRLTSPGPTLFRQRRVGRDGCEFMVLKFRTMREPTLHHAYEPRAGCAPGGVEGEDRRTRLGRFMRAASLDELPQLINVLRGDMSLVGPRPERPEFVARFLREVERYDDRHRVKSGITGWAQVNGLRGQTSIADRVEWDNYYISNWSLRLDFRILALTVATVLQLGGDGEGTEDPTGPFG